MGQSSQLIAPPDGRFRLPSTCPADYNRGMDEERKQPGLTIWISLALIPIAFYLFAFGPICWMNERGEQLGSLNASRVYRPLLALSSRGRLPPPLAWYACLGARKGADP